MSLMNSSRKVIRVVLASASDVEVGRRIAEEVIQELNSPTGELLGIAMGLVRWEDVPPGYDAGGPQGLIDGSFQMAESHVVLGVCGPRFALGPYYEGSH